MKKILRFPDGFLWGAATASYQVEGGIENCDWAEASRKGRVPICARACNHYNLYESDFDIVQNLGHNCHKISIEWARIEPEEGVFDLNEAAHYKNVIASLRMRGLEPFVNLWHFTLPLWFSRSGGFENPQSVERFTRYAEFVAKEILGDVKFVLTINEPLVWAGNGYMHGKWPPFKKNPQAYKKVWGNLVKAHIAAYKTIKLIRPEAQIGIAKHNMYFKALGPNPIQYIREALYKYFWNRRFLNKIKNHQDFIGLNFYFYRPLGKPFGKTFEKLPHLPKSDMGWDIFPEGIYHALMELTQYHKPIYVVENGLADADDSRREAFIRGYVANVHRAIENGAPIRGYMHWSLLDNYEWAEGFEKRFGLVEIDYKTLERHIRPSAYFYKNICETNTLELEEPELELKSEKY